MSLGTRLGRCLTLATCVLLVVGCATPEVAGIHQRDRDSWVDAEDATLGGALALCGRAIALLVITGLVAAAPSGAPTSTAPPAMSLTRSHRPTVGGLQEPRRVTTRLSAWPGRGRFRATASERLAPPSAAR